MFPVWKDEEGERMAEKKQEKENSVLFAIRVLLTTIINILILENSNVQTAIMAIMKSINSLPILI